jgi:hypothetical protein
VADEVRITDPVTGGQKGQKLAQLGALDPASLMHVAEVAGFGGKKYERYNFLKGYAWSLSYDAMQRHLNAYWGGQYLDEETGLPHLAHAAWHCLALMSFSERQLGTDDRPPSSRPEPHFAHCTCPPGRHVPFPMSSLSRGADDPR